MNAVIGRQKNHGMHLRVLVKVLRMSGGDRIHAATVIGKLEGERSITLGFVDLLHDDFIKKDRSCGIYFTQDWVSMPGALPVASGKHVYKLVMRDVTLPARVMKLSARLANEVLNYLLLVKIDVFFSILYTTVSDHGLSQASQFLPSTLQESSMEKSWFTLILSKGELEYRCGLSKLMDSRLGPFENTTVNENLTRNYTNKNIHDCSDSSSYYSKVDHLVDVKDIQNFISDDTFLIKE
ncbi:hypothetical protein Godav_022051 [Gossypium davidsonii]|uniref:Ribulose bisphosphate carboxylase large subunit C-terminal domain-containing protein n=1 Tax=Gossypium davidsonii TaxID=34287 RepID=A0A7J8TJU2_GOSDV|nr:hypothetical protein [Gossypium davidsonii]